MKNAPLDDDLDAYTSSCDGATQSHGFCQRREFIRGPLPVDWIAAAARLPGLALALALAIWFRRGVEQATSFPLYASTLAKFGVNRWSSYRALMALETAGLVTVERREGRCPVVTILEAWRNVAPTAAPSPESPEESRSVPRPSVPESLDSSGAAPEPATPKTTATSTRKRRRGRQSDVPPDQPSFEIPWKRAFYNWQQLYGLAGAAEKEVFLASFRKEISQEDRRLAAVSDAALIALLRGEVKVEQVKDAESIRFRLPAAVTSS
jgi:hypothetical protein